MRHEVTIEYELVRNGNRDALNPRYQSYVRAVEKNSGCSARSSIVEYSITVEELRKFKEEAKEAVLAMVREHVKEREKVMLESLILTTEQFELEI